MAKKQWIICGTCKYLSKCTAGNAKLINIDINSPVYNDIGCFDFQQYYDLINPKQMKLF